MPSSPTSLSSFSEENIQQAHLRVCTWRLTLVMTILPCFFWYVVQFRILLSCYFIPRRVRRNLGLEPLEVCGNRLRVVWVFGGGLAWIVLPIPLLLKRTFFPKSKTQSLICFGALEEVNNVSSFCWSEELTFRSVPLCKLLTTSTWNHFVECNHPWMLDLSCQFRDLTHHPRAKYAEVLGTQMFLKCLSSPCCFILDMK